MSKLLTDLAKNLLKAKAEKEKAEATYKEASAKVIAQLKEEKLKTFDFDNKVIGTSSKTTTSYDPMLLGALKKEGFTNYIVEAVDTSNFKKDYDKGGAFAEKFGIYVAQKESEPFITVNDKKGGKDGK